MVVRAICFDFDGTLAHFTGDFKRFSEGLSLELGVEGDLPGFTQQLSLELRREGEVTLRGALEALGKHPPEGLEAFAAKAAADYSRQMALLPGTEDVLEFCQACNLPLALVTNGPADMQHSAVRAVGLEGYFTRLVISGDAEVAVRKPDPRVFGLACEALASRPEETVMVGDNLEADVLGALRCGMQAVYLGTATGAGYTTLPDISAFGKLLRERL